jgi:hypothetical protein
MYIDYFRKAIKIFGINLIALKKEVDEKIRRMGREN